MKPAVTRSLIASLLAGLAAAPTAAVLSPIALLMGGREINLLEYLGVPAFAVASVAATFGLIACVVVGWPLLVVLSRIGFNCPAVVSLIGGALATAFLALVGEWPFLKAWPLYAYFAAIGAVCGAIASMASVPGGRARGRVVESDAD